MGYAADLLYADRLTEHGKMKGRRTTGLRNRQRLSLDCPPRPRGPAAHSGARACRPVLLCASGCDLCHISNKHG